MEWRNHVVTLEVMAAIKERIEEAKEVLVSSNDPEYDRLLKGMIRAYKDLLDVKLDDSPDLVSIQQAAEDE